MASSISSPRSNSVAYINSHIYTIDDRQPWAEAFIVSSNGTFNVVGRTADITAQAERDHIPQELTSSEELKKGRCMCKYTHANQDWLVGHAYKAEDFDRKALDVDFPETSVVVRGRAGHSAFVHSEALRRAGYDVQSEQDEQGTHYIRDKTTGQLTGEIAENALNKVMKTLPQPGITHIKRVPKEGQKMLHRAGVTSCQEASANTIMLTAPRELEAEGDLKLYFQTHIMYAPDWIGEGHSSTLHKLIDDAETFKSKHVDTRFVKIIMDGVLPESYYIHAALKADGKVDESKLFILNVHEAVRKYDERGMTLKIHCTGQGSTRVSLDIIEAARNANPNGPRHEIALCSGVHDDDYSRYKQLNVTAEMSPAFFFAHPITKASGGLMDWNFREMRAAEAHFTIGSDWGAGAEPDLLPCMANVVDDMGDGDKATGGERICQMLTSAGAEAVGREKTAGKRRVREEGQFHRCEQRSE